MRGEDDAFGAFARPVHHGAPHQDGVSRVEAHKHNLSRYGRQEVTHRLQV